MISDLKCGSIQDYLHNNLIQVETERVKVGLYKQCYSWKVKTCEMSALIRISIFSYPNNTEVNLQHLKKYYFKIFAKYIFKL